MIAPIISFDPVDIWLSGSRRCRYRPKTPRANVTMPTPAEMKMVVTFPPNMRHRPISRREAIRAYSNPPQAGSLHSPRTSVRNQPSACLRQ